MGEAYPPTPLIPEQEAEANSSARSTREVVASGETVHNEHLGQAPEDEEGEPSMPSTPLLEASPELEQGEFTASMPLSKSDSSASSSMEVTELELAPITVSKSSSASLKLGPGMEIDLQSLVIPSSTTEQHADGSTDDLPSDVLSPTSTITPSSSESSEPALSASNSLSCSPATSDSESFGNLSSAEEEEGEFDDSSSSSRRGSDDTSCEDDEEAEDVAELGDGYERDVALMGVDGNARTPTRISLLRPQHSLDQFNQANNKSAKKNGMKDQFDVGCVTIALPALDSDGYTSADQATFDLSTTANHRDPWNPSTF